MTLMATPSIVAAALSGLMPGLGQWANGKRAKGFALLCLTLGIWGVMALAQWGPSAFRSRFSLIVLGLTYVLVWIPAMVEAYRGDPEAAGSVLSGDRTWYVILMVFTLGAMALPLIWQSRRLSKGAKYAWSIIGMLNTVLAIAAAWVFGPAIEQSLNELQGLGLGVP